MFIFFDMLTPLRYCVQLLLLLESTILLFLFSIPTFENLILPSLGNFTFKGCCCCCPREFSSLYESLFPLLFECCSPLLFRLTEGRRYEGILLLLSLLSFFFWIIILFCESSVLLIIDNDYLYLIKAPSELWLQYSLPSFFTTQITL